MPTERVNDLQAFLEFAGGQIAHCDEHLTLDDVLALWEYENSSPEDREQAVHAIKQGLADLEAGRTSPADDVLGDLCRKYGIADPR